MPFPLSTNRRLSVNMQVSNFILLLTVVTTVTAQSECLDEQLRLPEVTDTLLEYCHHGEWRWICHDESQWNFERSEATCVQLGYSNERAFGQATVDSQNGSRRVVTLSDCNGPGLAECMVTPSDSCNSLVQLICNMAACVNSDTRLVGGSTDREGRVEVCDNSRWRTVCTGNQDLPVLAGGVCSRIGIQSLVLEVLMQVLSQQGAIRATHNKTSTHSSTLRPHLLIQPTVG
ncbi:scavenger receptor cysteine-rich domain superfamily protein-like isoform X2 [Halichondria panicea]|uniref:scavenger receptor cysteine-rich domain superfamily protein-like isoform X2 n=1 Tax=Halichondria panicea TaxID=6063 RepID=UPI00312B779A